MPPWREKQKLLPPRLVNEYRQYRLVHNGVSEGTLTRDLETAGSFLRHLQRRMKSIEYITLIDVDAFVRTLSARLAKIEPQDLAGAAGPPDEI
jgi:hypothetical protein